MKGDLALQKETGYFKEDTAGQENIFAVEVSKPAYFLLRPQLAYFDDVCNMGTVLKLGSEDGHGCAKMSSSFSCKLSSHCVI